MITNFHAQVTAAQSTEGESVEPGPVDHAQIYAAAIREIQTYEGPRSQVYVVTSTEDLVCADAPIAPSQAISAELQEAIAAELASERYKLIWIGAFDEAPIEPANWREAEGWRIADGDGLVITLGNIHLQEDGSVHLSFWMSCADMCGIGKTFVLNRSFDTWQITGNVGPVIVS